MSINLSASYPWDSLDKTILQRCAKLIRDSSEQDMETAVIEDCQKYLWFSDVSPESVSIATHSILGVDGAVIVVYFEEFPEIISDGYSEVAGMARLLETKEGVLPVILALPYTSEQTIEHECIHICQLLNPQPYLLTLAERMSIFQKQSEIVIKDILSESPERALDLLIRLTCYKVWMELEACYFTKTPDVLDHAYRSSQPIAAFKHCIFEWGIDTKVPDAYKRCIDEFHDFCTELKSQTDWIRDLIGDQHLYDALFWCKEEYETEMMLGPIEDFEYDFEEDDEDEYYDD